MLAPFPFLCLLCTMLNHIFCCSSWPSSLEAKSHSHLSVTCLRILQSLLSVVFELHHTWQHLLKTHIPGTHWSERVCFWGGRGEGYAAWGAEVLWAPGNWAHPSPYSLPPHVSIISPTSAAPQEHMDLNIVFKMKIKFQF